MPAEMPSTTPEALTVATPVLPLSQVPPTTEDVNVVVVPIHNDAVPVIFATGLIVTV